CADSGCLCSCHGPFLPSIGQRSQQCLTELLPFRTKEQVVKTLPMRLIDIIVPSEGSFESLGCLLATAGYVAGMYTDDRRHLLPRQLLDVQQEHQQTLTGLQRRDGLRDASDEQSPTLFAH